MKYEQMNYDMAIFAVAGFLIGFGLWGSVAIPYFSPTAFAIGIIVLPTWRFIRAALSAAKE